MNRIILIGNGFDLAHGMKTSYNNFIDDYWEKVIKEVKSKGYGSIYDNHDIKIDICPARHKIEEGYQTLKNALHEIDTSIEYNNQFLKIITEGSGLKKWRGIEDEYYRLLKKSINDSNKSGGYKIEDLNRDFKVIKDKLAEYLKRVEKEFNESNVPELQIIKDAIGTIVYQTFDYSYFTRTALNEEAKKQLELLRKDEELLVREEITYNDLSKRRVDLIKRIPTEANPLAEVKWTLRSQSASDYFDINPENILFLNFNYTATDKLYNNADARSKFSMRNSFNRGIIPTIQTNNIHGSIYDPEKNPIVFGFGDELDEEYKDIENLNDNRYLENIKSINYLESGSYKSLLQYIESGYYEIFIFGHSCGISDRTLLNTMFEHDNCASIKVFYRERENGSDNYSDIVRNISRNFNDKAKMRDRVVNKGSCVALVEKVAKKKDVEEVVHQMA